jgi:Fe2+ transport system protein FeoA
MPLKLSEITEGLDVIISEIYAGNRAIKNLTNLGLSVGNTIRVLRRSRLRGPVVVFYRGSEIAIGHGIAEKIVVKDI